ncbi:MAG: hypothetical protein K8R21_03695 [Leptospira sp.]|nr:hypothetical protein [Leptospira sp.]
MNIQSREVYISEYENTKCKPKLSGKWLPDKLRIIMFRKERKTLNEISKKHQISKMMISYVIHGERKSNRVEAILFEELKLTLSEIQQIIKEHNSRLIENRPIAPEEVFEWYQGYRAKNQGISIEEMKERDFVKKLPVGYFIKAQKREWYYRNKNKRSAA